MLVDKGTTQRILLLLLVIAPTIYGQTNGAVSTDQAEVVGSATIQFQGGNVTALQAQLANATKTAEVNIQQNPENLNSALQNLLTALGNAVLQILVEILQDGQVDAQKQSQQIAFEVGQSLKTISGSATGQLATLDASAVQQELQTTTFNILNNVTPTTNTTSLIQNLANEVLQIVGTALANTLDLEFRASVSLAQDTSTQSPSPVPSITGSSSGEISSDEIVLQLSQGNTSQAADILNQLLLQGKNQEIVDLFKQSFEDDTLEPLMEILLFSFYAQEDYLSQTLSIPLGIVFQVQPDDLGRLLSRVILNLDGNSTQVPNLITALEFGFTSQGENIQNMFTTSISLAILEEGCESVGLVLKEAFDKATAEGLGSLFTLNLEKSQQISECLEVGTQLQLSANIVTQLQQPRVAGNLVFRSIQDGSIAGVSGALVSAIENNSGEALRQTLKLVLAESSLNVSAFVDAFNEAYSQTSQPFQLALVLSQVLALDELPAARVTDILYAGLSQNQTEEAFTQVVLASIDGSKCTLEDAVDAVVQRVMSDGVTQDDYSPVFQQLRVNSQFRECVTGQTLVSAMGRISINISAIVTPEVFIPEKGALQLSNSIQRGSVERASKFLQQFITEQQANTSQLTLTLTLLLNTPDLSLANFALVYSQAVQSPVGDDIQSAFQEALQNLEPNINLLVDLFQAGLFNDATSTSFLQVILDSIKGGKCELLNVFDAIVEQSGNESIVIQQLVENEQLQECVSIQTLVEYVPISLLFNSTSFGLRLLTFPDVAAQIMFSSLQRGQFEASENMILFAFSEAPINGSELLVDVVEFLFDYDDFDMAQLISVLLNVVEDDSVEKTQLIQFLSDVFTSIDVNITQLASFLEQGLTEADTQQLFVQMVLGSIEGDNCGLGDALGVALQQAPETSPLSGIFLDNPEMYQCVDEDTFITATFKTQLIPSQILENPPLAATTLLATLQGNATETLLDGSSIDVVSDGSIEIVSSLLVNASDEGINSTTFSVTITLLLSEQELDIDNFVLSIALALQRLGIENSELEQALITSLLSADVNETVAEEVLEIGLTNNDTSDEFVQVALGSIEGSICRLLEPLSNIASRPEDQAIFIQLLEENENLTACVDQETLKNILPTSLFIKLYLSYSELFDNATLAADVISSAIQEGSIDTVSNFLVSAVNEDVNSTIIIDTLSLLVQEPNFDIDNLSLAIGLALQFSDNDEEVVSTIQKVITSSEFNSTVQSKILEAGLLNNQTEQAFIQVISSSIEGDFCALKDTFDQILQQPDIGTTIAQALIEDQNLRKCVTTETLTDVTNQLISFNISFATSQIFQSPEVAGQLIFSSLQEGSVESVSSLIVNAIEEDELNSTEISNSLSLVLSEPEVNISNFVLSVGLAFDYTTEQTELAATISEVLTQVNATTRTEILQEGLSNNQTLGTYIQIVRGSIEGNICQLKDELDEAVQNINIDNQLSEYLKEYPELYQCLSLETQIALQLKQESQQSAVLKQNLAASAPAPAPEEEDEDEDDIDENEVISGGNFGGPPESSISDSSTMLEKAISTSQLVVPAPEEEDDEIDELDEFGISSSTNVFSGFSGEGLSQPAPEAELFEIGESPLPEEEEEYNDDQLDSTSIQELEMTINESPLPEKEEYYDDDDLDSTSISEYNLAIEESPIPEEEDNEDLTEQVLVPSPEFEETIEVPIPKEEEENNDLLEQEIIPIPEEEEEHDDLSKQKEITPIPEEEKVEDLPEWELVPLPEQEEEDDDLPEFDSTPAPEFEAISTFIIPDLEEVPFDEAPILDEEIIPAPEFEEEQQLEENDEDISPAPEVEFIISAAFNQTGVSPEVKTAFDLALALQGESVENVSNILTDIITNSSTVENSNISLSTTISLLFQQPNINVGNLALAFGSIVNSTNDININNTVVIDTLSQILTSQELNLTLAIDLLDSGISNSETANSFFQIILNSIEGGVCELQDAFTEAVLLANDSSLIRQALEENEELKECVEPSVLNEILTQDVKLKVNVSTIFTQPQVAAETVFTQLQEGSVNDVSNLISEAANDTDNAMGLTATFQFLFSKPDVNVENFAVAFDSALNASTADQANLTSTLVKSLTVPELNVTVVGDLLDVGLSNNDTQETFIQVVKGSIEGNICTLQGAMDSAVEQSEGDSAILEVIEQNQDLQKCVSQNVLMKAVPNLVIRVAPISEEQILNTSSFTVIPTITVTTNFSTIVQQDDLDISSDVGFTQLPVPEPVAEARTSLKVQIGQSFNNSEQSAAANQGQHEVISGVISAAVQQNNFTEVTNTLDVVLSQENINASTLTLAIDTLLKQNPETVPIIANVVSNSSNDQLLVNIFAEGLMKSPQEFKQVIKNSIEVEDICVLEPVIGKVIQKEKSLLSLFESDIDLKKCIQDINLIAPVTEFVATPNIESQQQIFINNKTAPQQRIIYGERESDLEEPGFIIPPVKLTPSGQIFVPGPLTEKISIDVPKFFRTPEMEFPTPIRQLTPSKSPIPSPDHTPSIITQPNPSPYLSPNPLFPSPTTVRTFTPISPTVEVCPRMEFLVELQNGKQYLYGDNLRYEDAVEACICIGGQLVQFGDASEELLVSAAHEMKKLQKMILGEGDLQSRYWMGLYNPSGEISLDSWQWLDNNDGKITYENWRWDQPSFIVDGKREEECGEADAQYNECSGVRVQTYLAWNDASCQEYHQYICERKQAPRLQNIQGQVEFLYVPPLDRAYVFLTERKYSFYSAKLACDNMKGQMVQFRSRVEEDLVYGAIASVLSDYAVRPIWIGLEREETECIRQCNLCGCTQQDVNCDCSCDCALDQGDFYWVSGRQVGPYVNWMGQPCSGYKNDCLPPGRCVLTNVKKTPYNIQGYWTPHSDCGLMAYALCEIPGVYYSR